MAQRAETLPRSGVAGRTTTQKRGDFGVLPAVRKRLRTLPEALPELAAPSADSPSSILGISALLLLLLSGLGLVVYVVRFRPRATEITPKSASRIDSGPDA